MVKKIAEFLEFEPEFGHLLTGKLYQPNSKWVPILNHGRIRQQRKGMGSAFHLL